MKQIIFMISMSLIGCSLVVDFKDRNSFGCQGREVIDWSQASDDEAPKGIGQAVWNGMSLNERMMYVSDHAKEDPNNYCN
jgi:hypothetical protein